MVPSPSPIPGPLTQAVSSTDGNNKAGSYQVSHPRNSMSVTNTKGLLNMPGQNNCFLNSAVQVLWHLDIFRRSFRELSGHACMAESCIFCALKELFAQFQYSHESALPPDALRQALAKTFCDQRRFQLGFMDDAAECFENILLRIHVHIASQESEDMCGDLRCIPHQKFAMTLVEQLVCHNCGRRSEPLPFTQMVHYVTTSALCAKAQEIITSENGCFPNDSFGKLLKLAGEMGEVRKCPGECGSKINVKKTLMNHPEIVSVGLVWDSECPSIQHITDVFCNIGMHLQLQDMFHAVVDSERARTTYHYLVGVVTYYGKHYSTFFFHSKLRVWIYFDDATVREIGPSWEQVVEKCQRGHFQPLLLLYATPDVTSVVPPPTQNDVPMMDQSSTLTPRQAVMQQYNIFMNSLQNSGNVSSRNTHLSAKCYSPQGSYASSHYPENELMHGKNEPSSSKYCHCGRFLTSPICVCNPKQPQTTSSTTSEYANLPPAVFKHFSNDPKDLSKLNETALPFALPVTPTARNNAIQQNFTQNASSPKSHQVRCAFTLQGHNPEFETKETNGLSKTNSFYDEDDPEKGDAYISRKAVENVLHLQKMQQHQISLSRSYNHGVAGNRNSSSSLESFDNAGKLSKAEREPHILHVDGSRIRRDSGNWSSDHNSSSSLSTTSENCFFPGTPSKKATLGLKKFHSPTKAKLPDYSCVNSSDHGYDSYSVSSSDSYPSVGGSPIKLDPHLTRIPEDLQGPSDPEALSKKLQIITEESSGPPDCDKLCAEADLLLAKSHDKEKEGDLIMAALLSDSAAARARAAMEAPYNNPHSLVSAKMKHSTCVMRSSCLYRRIKDDEIDERRKQKGFSGHHSRQSSRDSTHSRHSHQSNKDKTHSKHSNKSNNQQGLEESETFGKNVEIYGTLPKKGSRRKLLASPDSTRVKDEQVYKDFLDKQRKNISTSNHLGDDVGKSGKSNQKVDSVKSKSEHSNEKHPSRLVHGSTSPKSPTHKKQDVSLVATSEDTGSGNNSSKRSASKQSYPSHLYSSNLSPKSADVACDDLVQDGLLSPVSSKKQHKIKRKLIGGFMKQKNRSLPDLREDQSVPDSLDRSFDDTSLQMSPTLMLPNGTLKKLECQTDSSMSTVPRGFHQPHYAFIKKDLSHRPLLVKVNPPNVQASVLNNSKSKLLRTLPSLPKKYESNTAEFNRKPSKIPFASFVPKKETSAPAPLSPINKPLEILPPPAVRPLRNSSIPVLTQQPASASTGTKSVADALIPIPPVTNQASVCFAEDLPPPSNPFLAELQARRRQIIGKNEKKRETSKANDVVSEPQPRALSGDTQSQLPEFSGNSDGVFWLQELQFKQHQMLQKPSSQVKPLFRTEKEIQESESKELNTQTSEPSVKVLNAKDDVSEYLKCTSDQKTATVSSSTLSSSAKNLADSSKCSPKIKSVSSSSSSVKDLASKFEKALSKTQLSNFQMNSSSLTDGTSQSQTSSENHSSSPSSRSTVSSGDENNPGSFKEHIRSPQQQNERTPELQLRVQKQKTSEPVYSPQVEETQCKETVLPPIHDTSINTSEPKAALCESGMNPAVRPQQPPDYETALQRLEIIRAAPQSEAPEVKTLEELKLPSFGLSSDVPASVESPKRKQGPKKTVTFSDKVVLVACADFEEDFLPNPLLERVYQQHSEMGGSETLNMCLNADLPSTYPESTSISCDTLPCTAPRPGGEMKLSSQSASTSHGSVPCNLCHTKYVTSPTLYCTDCEFYMSRFRP